MRTELRRPTDCSADDLDAFKKLLISAGEVDPEGFDQRLKSAEGLVFLYGAGEELVGVAAIKRRIKGTSKGYSRKQRVVKIQLDTYLNWAGLLWKIVSAEKLSLGLWLRALSRSSLARTCSLQPGQTISPCGRRMRNVGLL